MRNQCISFFLNRTVFMKTIASVVAVLLVWLFVYPTVLMAKTLEAQPSNAQPRGLSDEAELVQLLGKIEFRLTQLQEKIINAEDASLDAVELKKLHDRIKALDKRTRKNFERIEQHIIDKGLPAEILKRHVEMVNSYKAEFDTLITNLNALDMAPSDHERDARCQQTLNHLRAKQRRATHQPFDPMNLPNQNLRPIKGHKPKETSTNFRQDSLFNTPLVQFAALGDFTFSELADASNPAYLAETIEVTLTLGCLKTPLLGQIRCPVFGPRKDRSRCLFSWG